MFEGSDNIVWLTTLTLIIILAIFAMKFVAQMLKARAETAAATEMDTRLDLLEKSTGDIEHRLAHIEAMLKEVE